MRCLSIRVWETDEPETVPGDMNVTTCDNNTCSRRRVAGLCATAALELSVVMPCLNEERTLPVCIAKALKTMAGLGIEGEVLVVNNGSTDRSVEVARQSGARVVVQPLRGYGNALRMGFEEARGRFIVMADCDDSYDLTDLARFVEGLRGGAELVMGNRLAGVIRPGAMPWLHRYVGNPLLSRFLNLLFRTGVGDSHCGMRGLTKEAYGRMHLQMPGMELASEMVIKSSLAGLRVEEIPITLWPDGRNRRPHLRSFRDGWRHLRFMLMCSPMFLFVLPGLLLTLAGLVAIPAAAMAGYGVFTEAFGPNFMYTASLLFDHRGPRAGVRVLGQTLHAPGGPGLRGPSRHPLALLLFGRARADPRRSVARHGGGDRIEGAVSLAGHPYRALAGTVDLRRHAVHAGAGDRVHLVSRRHPRSAPRNKTRGKEGLGVRS